MSRLLLAATAVAAVFAAGSASAQVQGQALQVSYPTDASLDCAGIATEATRMDQLIADSNAQIAKADGAAQGAGLAGTVAVEGMLRSGVLARAPGLGMFANNAAAMAKQRAEANKQAYAQQIQTATTRKAMLVGMYSGKGCNAAPAAAPSQGF